MPGKTFGKFARWTEHPLKWYANRSAGPSKLQLNTHSSSHIWLQLRLGSFYPEILRLKACTYKLAKKWFAYLYAYKNLENNIIYSSWIGTVHRFCTAVIPQLLQSFFQTWQQLPIINMELWTLLLREKKQSAVFPFTVSHHVPSPCAFTMLFATRIVWHICSSLNEKLAPLVGLYSHNILIC